MGASNPLNGRCLTGFPRAAERGSGAQSHIDRHNSLLSWETGALLEIDLALRFYASGSHCQRCTAQVDACFEEWHSRARRRSLPTSPVYMLLCDGAFLKTIDQQFRRRNGWAKSAVLEVLQLWPSLWGEAVREDRRDFIWSAIAHQHQLPFQRCGVYDASN